MQRARARTSQKEVRAKALLGKHVVGVGPSRAGHTWERTRDWQALVAQAPRHWGHWGVHSRKVLSSNLERSGAARAEAEQSEGSRGH